MAGRHDLESQVAEAPSDLQRASAGNKRLVQLDKQCMHVRHERTHTSASAVVVQLCSEDLRLAQALQLVPEFTELRQHRAQLEADVQCFFQHRRALWQCLEDYERLLKPRPGARERRSCRRLVAGLSEILHRLLSQLAPKGVMAEPLDLLAQAIPVERLDCRDDPRVKLAATLLQQAPVGDLVSERVLE